MLVRHYSLSFLPTRSELDSESLEKGRQVTIIRRFVALAIDWFIIGLFSIPIIDHYLSNVLPPKAGEILSNTMSVFIIEVVVYFMLINYLLNGQTIGKKVVRIQVIEDGHKHIRLSTTNPAVFCALLSFLRAAANFSIHNDTFNFRKSHALYRLCDIRIVKFRNFTLTSIQLIVCSHKKKNPPIP